jgi:hypothetical protein
MLTVVDLRKAMENFKVAGAEIKLNQGVPVKVYNVTAVLYSVVPVLKTEIEIVANSAQTG